MAENATLCDEARVTALSRLVGSLSAAMDDQAEFHGGEAVMFGVRSLRDGAAFAARRAAKVAQAGPRQVREIEKTVLAELTRGALLAASALAEAGSEGWPCLEATAAEARTAIRDAAGRDASLLAPPGIEADRVRTCSDPAPFGAPPGWVAIGDERFACLGGDGVLLSVIAMRTDPGSVTWLGRVGGVGVASADEPRAAAAAASEAHRRLFSAPGPSPAPQALASGIPASGAQASGGA